VRGLVFRILAGLLSLLFAAVLIFADLGDISLVRKIIFWMVTIAFGVYAVFGSESGALRVLMPWSSQTSSESTDGTSDRRSPG
jgi:hypothetical protein